MKYIFSTCLPSSQNPATPGPHHCFHREEASLAWSVPTRSKSGRRCQGVLRLKIWVTFGSKFLGNLLL